MNVVLLTLGCGIKVESTDFGVSELTFCEVPYYIEGYNVQSSADIDHPDVIKIDRLLNTFSRMKSYVQISGGSQEFLATQGKTFAISYSFAKKPIGLSSAFNMELAVIVLTADGEKYIYNRFLDTFIEEIKHDCIK